MKIIKILLVATFCAGMLNAAYAGDGDTQPPPTPFDLSIFKLVQ